MERERLRHNVERGDEREYVKRKRVKIKICSEKRETVKRKNL
jgi:hypothetical protein